MYRVVLERKKKKKKKKSSSVCNKTLDGNYREFNLLSTRALQQAVREESMVCERLNLLLDILVAHRMLCERHERGVNTDHQRALSTMLSLKKRQMQGVIRGTDVRISYFRLTFTAKLYRGVIAVSCGLSGNRRRDCIITCLRKVL